MSLLSSGFDSRTQWRKFLIEDENDAYDFTDDDQEAHIVESLEEIALLSSGYETQADLDRLRAIVRREIQENTEGNLQLNELLTNPYYDLQPEHPSDKSNYEKGWFTSRMLGREEYIRIEFKLTSTPTFQFWLPQIGNICFYESFSHLKGVIGNDIFERLQKMGSSNLQVPFTHEMMHKVLSAVNIYGDVSPESINAFEEDAMFNRERCWAIFDIENVLRELQQTGEVDEQSRKNHDKLTDCLFVVPWPESDRRSFPIGYPGLPQTMNFHELPMPWAEQALIEFLRDTWSAWNPARSTPPHPARRSDTDIKADQPWLFPGVVD